MIELPDNPAPNAVDPELIDYGMFLRSPTGGSTLRVDRAGSRYKVTVGFPPMRPEVARVFTARLARAKREGLRIEYPLLGASQGNPGSPVVDGAGQAGTTIALTGLNPGYTVREGYWMTFVGNGGSRYLHQAVGVATADGDGAVSVSIEPPLRAPLPDGAEVLLAKPTIDGALIDTLGWSLSVDRLVRIGGAIVIEETEAVGGAMTVPSFDDDDAPPTFDMDS
ncbi:hypothetical protein ACWPMX_07770 [Tsuneonella sp. HG094]